MLGDRKHRRHFVMLVDEVDVGAVLGGVPSHRFWQGGIDAAEGHVHGLRAIGREDRVFRCGGLNANLETFHVADVADFLLAVDAAHALRAGGDDVQTLRGLVRSSP